MVVQTQLNVIHSIQM